MKIGTEKYVGVGFYRQGKDLKKYPIEASLNVETTKETCRMSGFWHRQSGMPKQAIDVLIEVTDSEEIKQATVSYFDQTLKGTILSVEGVV